MTLRFTLPLKTPAPANQGLFTLHGLRPDLFRLVRDSPTRIRWRSTARPAGCSINVVKPQAARRRATIRSSPKPSSPTCRRAWISASSSRAGPWWPARETSRGLLTRDRRRDGWRIAAAARSPRRRWPRRIILSASAFPRAAGSASGITGWLLARSRRCSNVSLSVGRAGGALRSNHAAALAAGRAQLRSTACSTLPAPATARR